MSTRRIGTASRILDIFDSRFRGAIYDNNNAVGSAGSVLSSTGSGVEWVTQSSGGTPGGSDGQIQYNNGGSFGGASSFYYDDTNNRIGIGESTPISSLDINVGTGTIAFNVTGSEGQLFSVRNNLSSGSIFSVNDISGIPLIDVDAGGSVILSSSNSTDYVGIGLTNPTQKLDVDGAARFRGAIYDNNNVVGLANSLLVSNGSGFEWTNISTIPFSSLDINVGTGTIAFNVTGSEGQLFSVRNNLSSGSIFSVNDISGIPLIDVDSDGSVQLVPFGVSDYVGIGLTNPTQKLDVDGGTRFRGAIYDNNNAVGSAGSVLASTGSGVQWVAQSGGGAELDITACLFT